MVGINLKVSCYHLNIDLKFTPHRPKMRSLNLERYEALRKRVQKLEENGFIREAIYPKWISNPILPKKHNDK